MKKNLDTVGNFSKNFDTMRLITIASIIAIVLCNIAWLYAYSLKDTEVGKRVYVVTDNGSFVASDKSEETVNQFEARNFLKVFMNNMFAHDASSFKRNIENGLNMINRKDGMRLYTDFKEGQVLETYVKYDSRSRIEIDSISLNMDVRPITGNVFAKQFTIYAGREIMTPIGAKLTLDRIDRSEKKPYGLMISTFSFVNYNPQLPTTNPDIVQEEERLKQAQADSILNAQ